MLKIYYYNHEVSNKAIAKSDKFGQCGFYNKSIFNATLFSVRPIHWFQFANDATVLSGQESENKVLLNHFTIWCQWADMIIQEDKCIMFSIKQSIPPQWSGNRIGNDRR